MIIGGVALLVAGILAAALFVSGWRGRSAASRRRALVTTLQISTPGVSGFIVLPCAAVMSAAGGVLLMTVGRTETAVAMQISMVVLLASTVAMFFLIICSAIAHSPMIAPDWFRQRDGRYDDGLGE